jgi:hypothetical protein
MELIALGILITLPLSILQSAKIGGNLLALKQLRGRGWPMAGYMQAACARRYLGLRFDRIPPFEDIATTPAMAGKDFGESFWHLMAFTAAYWREREAIGKESGRRHSR